MKTINKILPAALSTIQKSSPARLGVYGLLLLTALSLPAKAHATEPSNAEAAAGSVLDAKTVDDKLAGTDANNNGVRDDIEPFLTKHFSSDERIFRSVSNMLISFQYAIKATTLAESNRAQSMKIRAEECMISLASNLPPYLKALEQLEGLVKNTPAREKAYAAHLDRIADQFFARRNAPEWEDWCTKRVDLE